MSRAAEYAEKKIRKMQMRKSISETDSRRQEEQKKNITLGFLITNRKKENPCTENKK